MTTYFVYGVEPAGFTKTVSGQKVDKTYRLLAKSDDQTIAKSLADRYRRIFGQVIVSETMKIGSETTVEANAPF